MKTIVLIAALIAASGAMTDVSAQIGICMRNSDRCKDWKHFPHPHKSIRTQGASVCVSYDASSTVLTVQFTSNLHGSTVDVYRDGEKVAGITANSGTTFSCVLREYGVGNYNVIVSNGNTVIDSKNFTVR